MFIHARRNETLVQSRLPVLASIIAYKFAWMIAIVAVGQTIDFNLVNSVPESAAGTAPVAKFVPVDVTVPVATTQPDVILETQRISKEFGAGLTKALKEIGITTTTPESLQTTKSEKETPKPSDDFVEIRLCIRSETPFENVKRLVAMLVHVANSPLAVGDARPALRIALENAEANSAEILSPTAPISQLAVKIPRMLFHQTDVHFKTVTSRLRGQSWDLSGKIGGDGIELLPYDVQLWTVKANWSAYYQDVRDGLKDQSIDVDESTSGLRLVVPDDLVATYDPEKFSAIEKWLKDRQLLIRQVEFDHFGVAKHPNVGIRSMAVHNGKLADIGLKVNDAEKQAYVQFIGSALWTITMDGNLISIRRQFDVEERLHGAPFSIPTVVQESDISFEPVVDRVMLVDAMTAGKWTNWIQNGETQERHILVFKKRNLPTHSANPAFHVPSSVVKFQSVSYGSLPNNSAAFAPAFTGEFRRIRRIDDMSGDGVVAARSGRVGNATGPSNRQSSKSNTAADKGSNRADERQITIFALKYLQASEVEGLLQSLFGRSGDNSPAPIITKEDRTNRLIISATPKTIAEIEALIRTLDEQGAETAAKKVEPTPANTVSKQSISEMRDAYRNKEAEIVRLAKQVRDAQRSDNANDNKLIEDLTAKMRQLVGESFAVRQQLIQAELAQLQRQTLELQESLTLRYRIQDKIIDRRVSDLLDQNTSWEIERNK